ncbi:hypothetical protein Dimus_039479 [Dionaea muscipula]
MKMALGTLTVMKGKKCGSLYVLQGSTILGSVAISTSLSESDLTKLWHMRLGHISTKNMTMLRKRGLLSGQLKFCEHCVFGKQKRVSFDSAVHKTRSILDYVHSDLWGLFKFLPKVEHVIC